MNLSPPRLDEATLAGGTVRGALRPFLIVLYIGVAITHMLLPVQMGFPAIGRIHLTTLVLVGVMAILGFVRPRNLLAAATDRSSLILIAFGFLGVLTTYGVNGRRGFYEGFEQLPLAFFNLFLAYVVNLAMVRLLGTRRIYGILLAVGAVAAVLTVAEGQFGIRLPFYEAIQLVQLIKGTNSFTARAVGPLGNALFAAIQMSLVALIAMAESRGIVRVLIVATAIAGGLVTGSKMALIVVPVIAGILLRDTLRDANLSRARLRVGVWVMATVALVTIVVAAGPQAPVVGTLNDRLFGSQKDLSDAGAETRRDALYHLGYERLLGDPLHILFGEGAGVSAEAMIQLQGNATVDNAYLAIAFDYGLPILLVWVVGFLAPYVIPKRRVDSVPYYLAGGVVIALFGFAFNIHLVTTVMFLASTFAARCRAEGLVPPPKPITAESSN